MENKIVRFGEFDANLTTGELYFRGARRALEYRAFQLFALLVRRPGELVTNGEIEEFIWPDEQAIYDEPCMKRRIISAAFRLRSALGSSLKRFECVSKRGYRWIGQVQTRERSSSQEVCPYCGAAASPEPKAKRSEKTLVAVAGGARRVARHHRGYLAFAAEAGAVRKSGDRPVHRAALGESARLGGGPLSKTMPSPRAHRLRILPFAKPF
jgi:DNA-binding winged helix-turn-helix (wHTH) protein